MASRRDSRPLSAIDCDMEDVYTGSATIWSLLSDLHISVNQSTLFLLKPYQVTEHSSMKYQDWPQEESKKESRS